MDRHNASRLKICTSMAVFGTLGLFTRKIAVSSGSLALCRALLATALISAYFLITKQKLNARSIRRELPLLLLSGGIMGVNWILFFQAYRYTTISAATLSYYFAPSIVTIACPFLFHEKLTKKQIVCFVMSTVGLVMIVGAGGLRKGGTDLIGVMYGIGSAFFYAGVILLNKFIRGADGIRRTLFQFLAAIVVLTPYVALTGGLGLSALNAAGVICLLIVGLFHTGFTYCLYFTAIRDLNGQEIAILSYIDPLVSVLISVLILHEPFSALQLLGGALILGFTLWNEF